MMAAESACSALDSGDYSFDQYGHKIRKSQKARSMLLKRYAAERFYAGHSKWWILLGTVGAGALYTRASQMWEVVGGDRERLLAP